MKYKNECKQIVDWLNSNTKSDDWKLLDINKYEYHLDKYTFIVQKKKFNYSFEFLMMKNNCVVGIFDSDEIYELSFLALHINTNLYKEITNAVDSICKQLNNK